MLVSDFPALHHCEARVSCLPCMRFPLACSGALTGPESRNLIRFWRRGWGRSSRSKGSLRTLGDSGQCQGTKEAGSGSSGPRGQPTGTFRRLRCGLTLSTDPYQFQTCSGHSITKGLLVTKQPLPYLLHLPPFPSNPCTTQLRVKCL